MLNLRSSVRDTITKACLIAAVPLALTSCADSHRERSTDTNQTANVPEWVADAVFYQIFPERFANGDPTNDPIRSSIQNWQQTPEFWSVSEWTSDWYERSDWEKEMGGDFYQDGVFYRRYGGDLQGVIDRLDYLQDLGINAIYFNPIFHARSLHKYDGSTYHHVDAYFGPDPPRDLELMAAETSDPTTWKWTAADKLFLDLLRQARDRGIRIVLDGVWNHTGRDFFAFKDVRAKGEASAYRDWYIINSFDDPSTPEDEFDHQGWWGHKPLPEFADTPDGKNLHPGPKEYIFQSTRRWMDPDGDGDPSDGIAGWRLDVVPDMPIGFWTEWNAYVKSINGDAYTVSEIWQDASSDVQVGGFSGTMNYHAFAMPVKGFLVDRMISGERFVGMLEDRAEQYDRRNQTGLLNLVDSHDTPRIASMIVNRETVYTEPDVFDYDRDGWGGGADYSVRKPNESERRIQRMIALLQATFVGAPMIYYGTETGMWGADDPDDRMPMVWDELRYAVQSHDPSGRSSLSDTVAFDRDLFAFYRSVLHKRKQLKVLRNGDFRPIGTSDDPYALAFVRTLGSEKALVVMNRSDGDARVTIPITDAWEGASVAISSSESDDVRVTSNSGTLVVELAPLTATLLENSQTAETSSNKDD